MMAAPTAVPSGANARARTVAPSRVFSSRLVLTPVTLARRFLPSIPGGKDASNVVERGERVRGGDGHRCGGTEPAGEGGAGRSRAGRTGEAGAVGERGRRSRAARSGHWHRRDFLQGK